MRRNLETHTSKNSNDFRNLETPSFEGICRLKGWLVADYGVAEGDGLLNRSLSLLRRGKLRHYIRAI